MTKQEIKLIKEDLKKLLSAEISYCQESIGYTQSEYERGFEDGLIHISKNIVDKWAESLKELQ